MASPNVFVSSTFYDLRYIRERISFFIRSLGYNPILSEEGSVFYDPRRGTAEACVAEIPNCQMFVLVIGGRYGSEFPEERHSVTNAEYKEAVRLSIPVFALVEYGAHSDYELWRANRGRPAFDAASLTFPHADDPRIFDFIEEVRTKAVNNALIPFHDYSDIEGYLRQQWAGMMHSFLTGLGEEQRVEDMLSVITDMNTRIELLSTQILASVGSEREKALAAMYGRLLRSRAAEDLRYIGIYPTPSTVLRHETFDAHAEAYGKKWRPNDDEDDGNDDGTVISSLGEIAQYRYASSTQDYNELRTFIQEAQRDAGLTLADLRDLEGSAPDGATRTAGERESQPESA